MITHRPPAGKNFIYTSIGPADNTGPHVPQSLPPAADSDARHYPPVLDEAGDVVGYDTTAHVAEIAAGLEALFGRDPDRIVEIRVLDVEHRFHGTADGDGPRVYQRDGAHRGLYFGDECDLIAREVLPYDGRCRGVYAVTNPLKDTLYRGLVGTLRANNLPRLRRACETADDEAVELRDGFFIDLDAVRPRSEAKNPSTAAEKAAVWEAWETRIRPDLEARGFPRPTLIDTGNAYAAWYKIDHLPADSDLVHRVLLAWKARYDTDRVKVDEKVGNASRIGRIPGLLNRRGKDSADRPYRRARLLQVGEDRPVRIALLESEAAGIPPQPARTIATRPTGAATTGAATFAPAGGPYTPLTPLMERRAVGVLAKIPDAVQGENGSRPTLWAARCLVRGFRLSPADALKLLSRHYNPRCRPEWTDAELARKVDEAARRPFGKPDGWLLADRSTPPDPAPAGPPPDLDELFADLAGPQYVDPDERLEIPGGTKSSYKREVGEHFVTAESRLLNALIGRPPGAYCTSGRHVGLEGHSASAAFSAVVQVRCKCWSKCAPCRDYERHEVKAAVVPVAYRYGTHVFRGDADNWNAVRVRLAKLGIRHVSYAVSDGATRLTLICVAPGSRAVPEGLDGLTPLAGLAAATAVAAAIDDLPDHLPKGTRKFSPSHGWADLLDGGWTGVDEAEAVREAEAELVRDMTPEEREQRKQAQQAADQDAILAAGGIVWRRREDSPLRTLPEVVEILRSRGIPCKRGVIEDGNVIDSVVWETPTDPEDIEAVRRAIYELNITYTRPPDSGPPRAESDVFEPIPW